MTPYLQLLLNRKKNDPSVPYDDPNDPGVEQPMDERGPTIALRAPARYRTSDQPSEQNAPLVMSLPVGDGKYGERVVDRSGRIVATGTSQDVAPLATIPLARQTASVAPPAYPRLPVTSESPPELPPTVRLGARIAQDQRDIATAQSHHHSKARDILEGLGQYAGSGIGLNVHKLIYPRGTETEKAQRQLATDVGLQKVATDNADTQSTIALRSAQARKIEADLNNPDTSDEDKRKLQVAGEILKSHPQPFDPNDPADAVAIEKLNAAGIPIPKSYGKQPKEVTPLFREAKQKDGSVLTKKSVDGGKTWETVPDLTSEAPEKPVAGEVPDTTAPWIKEESDQREIARNANKSAAEARQSVLDYVKQNNLTPEQQKDDPRVLSALASAKRLDETEAEANKRAGDAHTKRIEAANKDAENRAKMKKPNSGLNIKGAIDHFKIKNGRAPTDAEIVKMQSALDAMP